MRTTTKLACLSVVALLAACGPTNDGYYDNNGNYVPYSATQRGIYNQAQFPDGEHVAVVSKTEHHETHPDYGSPYDRRGYYDYDGHYMTTVEGVSIPSKMYPPRGMCRVWFPERKAVNQPRIESCNGIQTRVPAGAYVIYGG